MNRLGIYSNYSEKALYIGAAILVVIVYLINLGRGAITMDEPTRALVAMEMIYSGNFITPTIFGEYYYNKPPMYNWLLTVLFRVTGDYSEWMVRYPAVIPLFLFGLTIFFHAKRYLSWQTSALSALMFMTCGRMLFTSSMVGHIDIMYSWLTYVSFLIIFELSQRKQWLLLFLLSYTITGITFLAKGLPSLVFQALSLLSWFIYIRKFKLLFGWQHILGIALLALILSSYFYAYHQHNSVITYFETLWYESSKRTPIEKSTLTSLLHLFTFPFEMLAHILPWSLLSIYALSKKMWGQWRDNSLLIFSVVMLGANLIPYWLSPDTHPRYLFMLFPLFFHLVAYSYTHQRKHWPILTRIIYLLFIVISVLLCLIIWVIPFLPQLKGLDLLKNIQQLEIIATFPYLWPKVIFLFTAMGLTCWALIRFPQYKVVLFVIMLCWFRLTFGWFVIPHRALTGKIAQYRENGIYVARMTEGEPLFVRPGFTFNHDLAYYISRERGEILPKSDMIQADAFYICTEWQLRGREYELYHAFETRHGRTPVYLVKFLNVKE